MDKRSMGMEEGFVYNEVGDDLAGIVFLLECC